MDHMTTENGRNLQDSENETGDRIYTFIDQLKDHVTASNQKELTLTILS